MSIKRGSMPLALVLVPFLAAAPSVWGQTAADFDDGRALLTDEPMFDAFYPTELESLADAKKSGRVTDDTALLVLQRNGVTLALLTMQMSYHHIAQGELEGEPWMVSF
ncbi:MAG: hypothetical protein ACR2QM_17855 [Longimicrobiales bacterium]